MIGIAGSPRFPRSRQETKGATQRNGGETRARENHLPPRARAPRLGPPRHATPRRRPVKGVRRVNKPLAFRLAAEFDDEQKTRPAVIEGPQLG